MTESDFFLQLSLSKADNPRVLYNFDGLNEVASCIIAIANNNPSAKFIIQGGDLECGYIRDKVKNKLLNAGNVMKEIIRLSSGGYVRFCSINGALTGTGYGLHDEQSIFGGFYVAFVKSNVEIDYARLKAETRCMTPKCNASAIIIVR